MLFRTVYGPELEAILRFLCQQKSALRKEIQRAFMPVPSKAPAALSTQNVDDALSFLVAAGLIQERKALFTSLCAKDLLVGDSLALQVQLLRQLRRLANGELEAKFSVDPLYMLLVERLFIKPDCLFVSDAHTQANKLREVKEVGGLSREKVQAWKRVMAFLGVGERVGKGFQCVYRPDLLRAILAMWPLQRGTLQSFFEFMSQFLPVQTARGTLAQAVELPLLYLARLGELSLTVAPDSPAKPYFKQQFRVLVRTD